jgi:Nitroreductase family
VIKKRRMVRAYTEEPVDPAVRDAILAAANRAPSAGFSQGYALLTLEGPDQLGPFWHLMSTYQAGEASAAASAGPAFEPVTRAPVVVVPLSCKDIYLDRYARPDKGWTDRDQAHWPVPYWDIDTGLTSRLSRTRPNHCGPDGEPLMRPRAPSAYQRPRCTRSPRARRLIFPPEPPWSAAGSGWPIATAPIGR